MKPSVLSLVAALLLAAPAAQAQELQSRWGSVEIGAGPFVPDLDSEFGGAATPYRDIFGGKPGPMFRLHVGKALFDRFGTLEVGIKTGFFSKSGHALGEPTNPTDPPVKTGDQARISVIPTSLTLTYRMDNVWEHAHVPVVPYVRGTLERYNWWTSKEEKTTERGATNGWSASVGLVLILDWIDPAAALDAANDVGIAHTGLYLDITKSKVDDFGSSKSWDMSNRNDLFWSGGLTVIF